MIFAWHGSDKFQKFMAKELKELSEKVEKILGDNLVSLILGGGYGRSEGGIVNIDGIEMPYNDLDMVIIVKDLNQNFDKLLLPVRKEWGQRLGIHVDFSRPLTVRQLRHLPHKLMWQDLLFGHIVLCKEKDVLLTNMPALMKETLPAIEASHLLLNRGAGLIWSMQIFHGVISEQDDDFIRRNYFKAALAIGDAILISNQMHQTKYQGRDILLKSLFARQNIPEMDVIMPLYERALKFKFSPDEEQAFSATITDLQRMATILVNTFLHIESVRTVQTFKTAADYQSWKGLRQPEEHQLTHIPRNIFQNIKRKRFSVLYPREILFKKMPSLLLSSFSASPKWEKASKEFLELWNKFN